MTTTSPILELRVALTTKGYEKLVNFYCEGLGIKPQQLWTGGEDRALILEMGQATLEIFDEAHAEVIDQLEVGERVSGAIRFALRIDDLDAALERLLARGAKLVHAPVVTPWGHRNARVSDPDGLHHVVSSVVIPLRER